MAHARYLRSAAVLLFVLAVVATGPAAAGAPRVVVSVAPLHSLAAMVMGDAGTPTLLLRGTASPHSYALRPSQTRALSEAALVIRIGAGLEPFLDKAIASLKLDARLLDVSTLPGLIRLPRRTGGAWESAPGAAGAEGDDGHHRHDRDHPHGAAPDPHLWLHTGNARIIVAAIANRLAAVDPANAAVYRRNAAAASEAIVRLQADMTRVLRPVRGVPFAVLHDAWQYVEQEFGLRSVGAIAVSPERPPGARHLVALRARIRETGTRCVFSEPQFSAAIVRTVVRDTPARTATLDPLGAALAPGPALYPDMMRRLALDLSNCLRPDAG